MFSLSQLRGEKLSTWIAVIGAFSFALHGYDQAVTNGLLTLNSFLEVFPSIDTVNTTGSVKKHNSNIQGTAVGVYEVGSAFGAIACFTLGDRLGRRKIIILMGITVLIGTIIQAAAFSLAQLIVSRVIAGFGVGGFVATVPMWVSECTSAKNRGARVLLSGFFAIVGIVVVVWIEFGLFYVQNSSVNWRFPIALQAIFPIIIIPCMFFLPESPRLLVKQGKLAEAKEVLARLEDLPLEHDMVETEVAIIQQSLLEDNGGQSVFSMNKSRHFHRTMMAVLLQIFQQMCGISIITFYSTTIFEGQLHYTPTIARIITGCLQIWQMCCALLSVFMVDRFGRRPLLISGNLIMCVSHICLAGLTSDIAQPSAAKASILFYFTALFAYPTGLFLVPLMYSAEIAPLKTRAKVSAIAVCLQKLFNFMVAEVTPPAFDSISWRYYIVYAACTLFAAIGIYFCYPETKGRTLEEIDDIFIQSRNIFDPVRIERKMPLMLSLGLNGEPILEPGEKVQAVDHID